LSWVDPLGEQFFLGPPQSGMAEHVQNIPGTITPEEMAMSMAATVPGVGEAMDLSVLADPNSSLWEQILAMGSLGANALTDGLLPNAGGLLKASKCKVKGSYVHEFGSGKKYIGKGTASGGQNWRPTSENEI
jgi:hypothetical protein